MKKPTKKVIKQLPKKLYIYDPGYHSNMYNGKLKEQDFKNVFICDTNDTNPETWWLYVSVRKETEERDMLMAEIFRASVENFHKSKSK